MTPGEYDFQWVRGTTSPLVVALKTNNVPIPYDDIRLSVYKKKELAFRITLAENEDAAGPQSPGTVRVISPGTFAFMPTAEQTRSLFQTPNDGSPGKNSYEIEVRVGEAEDVYLLGVIAAIGGINDDEEIS
jgi:hypothetical protein